MTDTKTDREKIDEMTKGQPGLFFYDNVAPKIVQAFLMDQEVHIASFKTGAEFCYCLDRWITKNRKTIPNELGLVI